MVGTCCGGGMTVASQSSSMTKEDRMIKEICDFCEVS